MELANFSKSIVRKKYLLRALFVVTLLVPISVPLLFCVMCCFLFRVIDVGSEWRTFSNERSATDRSRVGAAEVCGVFRPQDARLILSPNIPIFAFVIDQARHKRSKKNHPQLIFCD